MSPTLLFLLSTLTVNPVLLSASKGSDVHGSRAGEAAVVLSQLPEAAVPAMQAPPGPPWAQSAAYHTGLPDPQSEFRPPALCPLQVPEEFNFLPLQEKVIKEVNFILANQDVIQNQISQLEDAIKQMEVKLEDTCAKTKLCMNSPNKSK